uniref:Putative salivary lipocalin n=1 Tax=Ixodes ricinus TaxID=34613 RepID=A0A0K8RD86_IXORI
MPRCLQCGACPVLLFLCCLGFFLAFRATAANTPQEGTPVDISKMLGEVHGKMFDYVYMKSESLILTDSTATCLTLQFLYSQEETSSVGELWAHYKTTGGNRHVKRIELGYKEAKGKKLGNTLILTFSKSCNKGPHPNRVEYEVHERNLCYVLKATQMSECFIIGLITSSSHNHPQHCLSNAELVQCKYEVFSVSETHPCLEYEEVTDPEGDVKQDTEEDPTDTTPLSERHKLLQSYQNFTQGLLFGTLLLVYSSLAEDPSRLCMITYYPNEEPGPDGRLHILTTFTQEKKFIVQTYTPYTVNGYDTKYATEARIFRKGVFYETRVIFTDGRRCTILRTKGYHNLCELFTGGRFNNGIVNSYCFFVYLVYCNQPAKIFTKLSDCWPPAKTPNP